MISIQFKIQPRQILWVFGLKFFSVHKQPLVFVQCNYSSCIIHTLLFILTVYMYIYHTTICVYLYLSNFLVAPFLVGSSTFSLPSILMSRNPEEQLCCFGITVWIFFSNPLPTLTFTRSDAFTIRKYVNPTIFNIKSGEMCIFPTPLVLNPSLYTTYNYRVVFKSKSWYFKLPILSGWTYCFEVSFNIVVGAGVASVNRTPSNVKLLMSSIIPPFLFPF